MVLSADSKEEKVTFLKLSMDLKGYEWLKGKSRNKVVIDVLSNKK